MYYALVSQNDNNNIYCALYCAAQRRIQNKNLLSLTLDHIQKNINLMANGFLTET